MTHTTRPEILRGFAVINAAVDAARDAFRADLTAAYAFGSLTHGGYDPLVSDIDLLFVLRGDLTAATRATLDYVEDVVAEACPDLGRRLAVFWTSEALLPERAVSGAYPPADLSTGFLPPLDRLDLLQNGKLLVGRDVRDEVPRPTTDELIVAGAEFALSYLRGERLLRFLDQPDLLVCQGPLEVTKTILFPIRFLYTLRTGCIGANYEAADHFTGFTDNAAQRTLAYAAIEWRRAGLPDAADAVPLLHGALRALYIEMVEAYAAVVADLDAQELEAELRAWGRELRGHS
jgi:predicted nucleotidyltransferase